MSGVIRALKHGVLAYGSALLLALLLHALLFAAIVQITFKPHVKPAATTPIPAYWYQPPPAAEPQVTVAADANVTVTEAAVAQPPAAPIAQVDTPVLSAEAGRVDAGNDAAAPQTLNPTTAPVAATATEARMATGITQRAFSRAATASPAVREQAAAASYQQFLQAEQQPKITVEKRHQELSDDPAQQVVAQLDDGIQLIRTKGGCRIADPSKDGFDALMAANPIVPCGDEAKTSDLLKQALEKHSKR